MLQAQHGVLAPLHGLWMVAVNDPQPEHVGALTALRVYNANHERIFEEVQVMVTPLWNNVDPPPWKVAFKPDDSAVARAVTGALRSKKMSCVTEDGTIVVEVTLTREGKGEIETELSKLKKTTSKGKARPTSRRAAVSTSRSSTSPSSTSPSPLTPLSYSQRCQCPLSPSTSSRARSSYQRRRRRRALRRSPTRWARLTRTRLTSTCLVASGRQRGRLRKRSAGSSPCSATLSRSTSLTRCGTRLCRHRRAPAVQSAARAPRAPRAPHARASGPTPRAVSAGARTATDSTRAAGTGHGWLARTWSSASTWRRSLPTATEAPRDHAMAHGPLQVTVCSLQDAPSGAWE